MHAEYTTKCQAKDDPRKTKWEYISLYCMLKQDLCHDVLRLKHSGLARVNVYFNHIIISYIKEKA